MDKKVEIAIIGAGTAGLSAYKEASKYTNNILLIDKGPLGSTCARVGCMPSKQLIHIANQFYERHHFSTMGIDGAKQLRINISEALAHVRKMRDHFTAGVVKFTESLKNQFIRGEAKFVEPNILKVGKQQITANKVIIATGSSSYIPDDWQVDYSNLLTSEIIFEQENLADEMSVIGGGIIGLELGQALSRLGIKISLYHAGDFIAGLTDPKVNSAAIKILKNEFPIYLNERVSVSKANKGHLTIKTSSGSHTIASVLVAMGRKPNLENLDLESLEVELNEFNVPKYDNTTMQINNLPIYIAGDANKTRPLLHEAADEGRIAGFNAANSDNQCFVRRTPMRILFSQPNIVVIGQPFSEINQNEYVIGEVGYDNQGRAKIENHNQGILRVYGLKKTGKLVGAECIAPAGEHLAHLLAWAIQKEMTVFEILKMPFYHPVLEEGVRSALHDIAKKVEAKPKSFELTLCDSEAIHLLT